MTVTLQGFSTQKPEDIQKVKDLLFRKPTEEERVAHKPEGERPSPKEEPKETSVEAIFGKKKKKKGD